MVSRAHVQGVKVILLYLCGDGVSNWTVVHVKLLISVGKYSTNQVYSLNMLHYVPVSKRRN